MSVGIVVITTFELKTKNGWDQYNKLSLFEILRVSWVAFLT